MTKAGLRSTVGAACAPFTKGPYTWDQTLSFGGSASTTAVQTSADNTRQLAVYLNTSQTVATNGSRAVYARLWVSGAGGGGEAVRAFTTVNNVAADTVHGLHASVSCGTTGTITGLGVAVRATLQVPNGNLAGTTAAVQAELWADGSSSQNTGTMSMFRCVIGGDGTGVANLKDAYFAEFAGMSAGSGEFIDTSKTAGTAYGGLKVKIPGVGDKWILLVSA